MKEDQPLKTRQQTWVAHCDDEEDGFRELFIGHTGEGQRAWPPPMFVKEAGVRFKLASVLVALDGELAVLLRCEQVSDLLPNGPRVSCGALKRDSFPNLRAPPASSAC